MTRGYQINLLKFDLYLLPECLNQVEVCKFMKLHKGMKNLNVELIPGNEIK